MIYKIYAESDDKRVHGFSTKEDCHIKIYDHFRSYENNVERTRYIRIAINIENLIEAGWTNGERFRIFFDYKIFGKIMLRKSAPNMPGIQWLVQQNGYEPCGNFKLYSRLEEMYKPGKYTAKTRVDGDRIFIRINYT